MTFVSLLSKWNGKELKLFKILGGVLTILFLCIYSSAQLKAGSKALEVIFNWHPSTGPIIGAIMVLIYCYSGGIRASIWTDVAQSIVMLLAMMILCFYSVHYVGGLQIFIAKLYAVSPTYMNWFYNQWPFGPYLGPIVFIFSFFLAGIGACSQPHMIIRYMIINDEKNIPKARVYYYTYYTLFSMMSLFVGLAARVIIQHSASFDPEFALPEISKLLLPEVLVGVVLAGLFSSTMSTVDSQIICCTASLTEDILQKRQRTFYTKIYTVMFTLSALMIALFAPNNVFSLVLISYSGLASLFTPIVILLALGYPLSDKTAVGVMLSSFFTLLLWRYWGLHDFVYELVPGVLAGFLTYIMIYIQEKIRENKLLVSLN